MQPINWADKYFDNGERIVLTNSELHINGLRMFGRHFLTKAISPLQLHFHENSFEFTYIIKGNVTFSVNDKEYKLSGGDIFVAFPNEIHDTGSIPMSANEMYWFQLDISRYQDFLFLGNDWALDLISNLKKIQNRVIKTDDKEMASLIKRCFSLLYQCDDSNRYEATGLLVVFLHRLLDYDKQIQFKLTPDIAKAVDYIFNNINEEISLDDLANQSGLSISRFKQKFKNEMGVTPREFINFRKVEIAKTMLLNKQSITSIAMELGFSTSNYFAVVFKRFTTYSPSEYMKKHNKNNNIK